jgi:hypothetical protein
MKTALLRFLLIVALSASVAIGIWQGIAAGVLSLAAVALYFVFSHFGSVAELTIGPLRARLRENISESEELIATLKQSMFQLTTNALNALAWQTRLGGPSTRKRQEALANFMAQLKSAGFTDEEVRAELSDYIRLTSLDFVDSISGHQPPEFGGRTRRTEWAMLREALLEPAPPAELRRFLEQIDAMSEELDSAINDYERFLQTLEIRDPEFLDDYDRNLKRVPGAGAKFDD